MEFLSSLRNVVFAPDVMCKCAAGLDEMIEIAGTVDHSVNLNGQTTNAVENKVGLNNQDSLTVVTQLGVPRNSSQEWMALQCTYLLVKLVNKC